MGRIKRATVERLVDGLTDEERARLAALAEGRGDDAEAERLRGSVAGRTVAEVARELVRALLPDDGVEVPCWRDLSPEARELATRMRLAHRLPGSDSPEGGDRA